MRYTSISTPLLTLLLLWCLPAWAQPSPKLPVVVCPRVAQPPKLDGRLDPTEWAAAGTLSEFVLLGARGLPRLPTRAYVMHTTGGLYIGAQMYDDKPADIVANVTERDGRAYEDDCVEVFVDTEGRRAECAHLVVNSLGTKFDEYGHDVAENFDWSVFAAVNDTGWVLEMELPFDGGTPPLEGEVWNLGVCRNAVRVGEQSGWSRHERDFNEPSAFGELIFTAPLLTAKADDVGNRAFGDNLALVTIENLSQVPANVKLNVQVAGKDRRSHYFGTLKKQLGGRANEQLYVPYKVRRCGPAWLTLSLTDEKGTVAWRSAGLPIDLPDLSNALDQTASVLAEAWRLWATIQPSDAKDRLRSSLDGLQREWSFLDQQVVSAEGVAISRLNALYLEAGALLKRAEQGRDDTKQVAAGREPG